MITSQLACIHAKFAAMGTRLPISFAKFLQWNRCLIALHGSREFSTHGVNSSQPLSGFWPLLPIESFSMYISDLQIYTELEYCNQGVGFQQNSVPGLCVSIFAWMFKLATFLTLLQIAIGIFLLLQNVFCISI